MPMITFEATEEEKKVIERVAKKEGMTISEYVRACVFLDLFVSGDLEALKILSRRFRDRGAKFLERFRRSGVKILAG